MKSALAVLLVLGGSSLYAQGLPDGPGKDVTVKLCGNCHEAAQVAAHPADRSGWESIINDMIAQGFEASPEELRQVLDYLAAAFPPVEAARGLNINTATNVELESVLGLLRKESAALIAYREKNGKFKSIAALKKIPGVDFKKIEARKDILVF